MDKVKERRNKKIIIARNNGDWDEVSRLLEQEIENLYRNDRKYGLLSLDYFYNEDGEYEFGDFISTNSNPLEELIHSELIHQLYLEIEKLPEIDQEIIIGYYFENETKTELSKRLSVDYKTIVNHLNKTLSRLKEKLDDYY